MNIHVYGANFYWAQASRIKQGLIGLGHTVNSSSCDFVYSNNFSYCDYDESLNNSAYDNPSPKIFNVLDIPPHDETFPLDDLKNQLQIADAITCISPPVQDQLRDIGFDASVIWNPIKDVSFDPATPRNIKCLYVGRADDPNKRVALLSDFEEDCVSVGPFNSFGRNFGLVSDVQLNFYYNSAKIVALPSRFEGLGLPVLEAMVCGAVPLVCRDNPNANLCPDFCICDPTKDSVQKKYKEILGNFDHYQSIILESYSCQIAHKFSKFSIAESILTIGKRITNNKTETIV